MSELLLILQKMKSNKVFNPTEANKFKLLINTNNSGSSNKSKAHKCTILPIMEEGNLTWMNQTPIYDIVPSKVEGFVGRQREIYDIIDLLDQNRLVSILGPPGIGKTSISRNLANYVKDRRKFNDGIIYIALRGVETVHMFLTRLALLVMSKLPSDKASKLEISVSESDMEEIVDTVDQDLVYQKFIIDSLKDKEVLIILDNAEDLLVNWNQRFIEEINTILENCIGIKSLATSRKNISKLSHVSQRPYILQPLSNQESLKLLISKSPRRINDQECKELLTCEIPKIAIANSVTNNQKSGKMTLVDHPFTGLLGGHPHAISLAAPLLEYKSLKQLFYQFWDSNIMDALEVSGFKDQNSSLRVSLELSIKSVQSTTPASLNLFSFIGLLPGGVTDYELTQMWGGTQWMKLKDSLIRASLLIYKTDISGNFIFSMLPFMSVRAYELLQKDEFLKHSYHIKWCKLFKQYWIEFYDSEKTNDDVVKLISYETNIWAWIYRSLDRNKDIKYEKVDPKEETQDIADDDDDLEYSYERNPAIMNNISDKDELETT